MFGLSGDEADLWWEGSVAVTVIKAGESSMASKYSVSSSSSLASSFLGLSLTPVHTQVVKNRHNSSITAVMLVYHHAMSQLSSFTSIIFIYEWSRCSSVSHPCWWWAYRVCWPRAWGPLSRLVPGCCAAWLAARWSPPGVCAALAHAEVRAAICGCGSLPGSRNLDTPVQEDYKHTNTEASGTTWKCYLYQGFDSAPKDQPLWRVLIQSQLKQ